MNDILQSVPESMRVRTKHVGKCMMVCGANG